MTIANSIILADGAYGTIASGLSVSDTALTFTTGHGARFPAVAAGQVLYCDILNSTNVLEEIQVTAHVNGSDSATIVRGVGGTTAKTWVAGDRIEARVSSTVLKRLQDESLKKTTLTTADSGATYTGAMDVPGLGYVTGLIYPMTIAVSNIGTAPTIALDGLPAVTVVLDAGIALQTGQMPTNGLYAHDGTNFVLLNPLPIAGVMKDFGGTAAPAGYLACDGSNVSRTTYARLFSAISTTWGAGNGSTTFTVPDSRRRTAVGSGGAGTGTLAATVGSTGGEESHTLSTAEIASHQHNTNYTGATTPGGGISNLVQNPSLGGAGTWSTDPTGGGGAHNNMQPSYVITKIIRY